MKFDKKYIISALVLVVAVVLSATLTYSRKANADEETLQQVKEELQEQINAKSEELEDKEKQLESLNAKITEQQSTIDNLNNIVSNLSGAVNATQEDLSSAKATQKADKVEVTNHTDQGDADLQQQIDTINSNYGENREVQKPSNSDTIEPEKEECRNENGTR